MEKITFSRTDISEDVLLQLTKTSELIKRLLDVAEIHIGNNCLIGPDVGIYTAGHRLQPEGRTLDGYGIPITIGNDVWVGGHSVILPGVVIGDGAVIAAGSVVTSNVAPRTLVAGNPAKFKKEII